MGTLRDHNPEAGGPGNTSQFADDSVLARMTRGNYKPTDTDVDELTKLAQSGNRAERRAAGKHLKKHGIAAPPASPRQPIVAPTPVEVALTPKPAPAPKKAAVKKTAVKKTAVKKTAVKKAAVKKTAFKKTVVKKAAVKKTAVKKTAAKKKRRS